LGYWQEHAERRWFSVAAIVLTALFFALGPHPHALGLLAFFVGVGCSISNSHLADRPIESSA
jgi:membrane protease YdiL (CAAX protease family)